MNDEIEYNPTPEQQLVWVQEALIQDGFERMSISSSKLSYYKEMRENVAIVVNLDDGKHDISFLAFGKRVDEDRDNFLGRIGTLIADAMILPTTTASSEVIGDAMPPVENAVSNTQKPAKNTDFVGESVKNDDSVFSNVPTVHKSPIGYKPTLSVSVIKKYINDKVTDEEAYVFLELCKARNLNPFVGDVHLIKYDHTKPATMVVAKDAFMKRAESHPQYDGFEAGIIIENTTGNTEHRIGTFYKDNEILLGGWAKVHRKDYAYPSDITVSFREFNTGKSSWNKMPAIMIRKVAIVNAMRESFPSELGGLYDASEMGVDIV